MQFTYSTTHRYAPFKEYPFKKKKLRWRASIWILRRIPTVNSRLTLGELPGWLFDFFLILSFCCPHTPAMYSSVLWYICDQESDNASNEANKLALSVLSCVCSLPAGGTRRCTQLRAATIKQFRLITYFFLLIPLHEKYGMEGMKKDLRERYSSARRKGRVKREGGKEEKYLARAAHVFLALVSVCLLRLSVLYMSIITKQKKSKANNKQLATMPLENIPSRPSMSFQKAQ